jgi:hypothetical protein
MRGDDTKLLGRVLVNAATKPLNVLVLGVFAAVALVVNPWLLVAAPVVYGALVAATVRDPREQARIARAEEARLVDSARGRDLGAVRPPLREPILAALADEQRIHAELSTGTIAPAGLGDDVTALCDDLVRVAARGSAIDEYLASVDEGDLRRRAAEYGALRDPSARVRDAVAALREQLAVIDSLRARRAELDAEVLRIQASLGTIRARLVQARTGGDTADLGADVGTLRERVRALVDAFAEAQRPA